MNMGCLYGWKRFQVIVKIFQAKRASVLFCKEVSTRHVHILPKYRTQRGATHVFLHLNNPLTGTVKGLLKCRNTFSVLMRLLSDQTTEAFEFIPGENPSQEVMINAMIDASVEQIMKAPISRYGDLGSKTKEEIGESLRSFINNGFPCELLGQFAENLQVLQNPQRLIDLLKTFHELEMSKNDIKRIIENDVGVLKLRKEVFKDTFYKLLSAGFPSETILKMIVEHPKLITTDLGKVERRIEEIKVLFSNQDTYRLMKESPKLLFCDLEEIKMKFNYVYHEMGIEQPKMMRSKVFSHSLEHIHVRHMFLVRTGFYRKVKEKDRFRNPPLNMILESSDADFAKTFGNMTEDDLVCFKELLLNEKMLDNLDQDDGKEKNETSFSDDDSDSDDSDSE